ncbi:Uncharacterised protein [Chlamydia trachomatis]|nr:Uncharacterised protein [Chlamydia trachomatis]
MEKVTGDVPSAERNHGQGRGRASRRGAAVSHPDGTQLRERDARRDNRAAAQELVKDDEQGWAA